MLTARVSPCAATDRSLTHLLRAIVLLIVSAAAPAASSQVSPPVAPAAIVSRQPLFDLLQQLDREHAPPSRVGYVWALIASSWQDTGDLTEAMRAYHRALPLLAQEARSTANYATALDNLGELYLEAGNLNEAETVRTKAFHLRSELGKEPDIARSRQHLAEIYLAQHRFRQAEEHASAAYRTLAAHPEPDTYRITPSSSPAFTPRHGNMLLSTLVTLTYAQCMQSKTSVCMQSAREADQVATRSFAADSIERGHADMALGFALWKTGDLPAAERSMQDGVSLMKARFGGAHPIVISAMLEYRELLKAQRRKAEANAVDQAIRDATMSHPHPCVHCSVSVYALR